MHPTKTKIVYCKDDNRRGTYDQTKFDFLGYEFRPRGVKNSKTGKLFMSFTAAVSATTLKAMRQRVRRMGFRKRTELKLEDIAWKLNPILHGWIEYYGRFQPSALAPLLRSVNVMLVRWAMRKYKRLHEKKTRAMNFVKGIAQKCPKLFAHWSRGMVGSFA